MIVNVCFAGVFLVEVAMRHVRMAQRRVIMLVLMGGTQMLEASGHLVVIVCDMKVSMGVH